MGEGDKNQAGASAKLGHMAIGTSAKLGPNSPSAWKQKTSAREAPDAAIVGGSASLMGYWVDGAPDAANVGGSASLMGYWVDYARNFHLASTDTDADTMAVAMEDGKWFELGTLNYISEAHAARSSGSDA